MRDMILRLKTGDKGAFAEVFEVYHKRIYDYVFRLSGGNEPVCDDIVQQAFLNFWKNKSNFDEERPVGPYLLAIARNAWINSVKKETPDKVQLTEQSAQAPYHSEPNLRVEQKELEESVEKAVSKMPESVREVFFLSRCQGLKYSEISGVMMISIKTVEARMSKALDLLRRELKDFIEE